MVAIRKNLTTVSSKQKHKKKHKKKKDGSSLIPTRGGPSMEALDQWSSRCTRRVLTLFGGNLGGIPHRARPHL